MTDGSALLMSMIWGFRGDGPLVATTRGTNLLDTGAHFYDTYETRGRQMDLARRDRAAILCRVPRRHGARRRRHGPRRWTRAAGRRSRRELTTRFKTQTRDDWVAAFTGHEVCFAPVLDFDEALADAHNRARGTFVEAGGVTQPAPAPRYSASETVAPVMATDRHDAAVLADLGFSSDEIAALGH